MPIKKTAGAVVFYRNPNGKIEYLLLKHNERYWYFPKGEIEKKEKEINAAERETREETGLDNLEIISGFKTKESFSFIASRNFYKGNMRGQKIFKTVAFYLVESKNKNVKISHEHKGFEWLDFEKAIERLGKNRFRKKSQGVLTRANKFILGMKE
ncbi:NUDIX domain-containing protein [Patescibacteria group bacterium]|nr:NUDIX domain-containing protein [Patescibacteria group bacterium]